MLGVGLQEGDYYNSQRRDHEVLNWSMGLGVKEECSEEKNWASRLESVWWLTDGCEERGKEMETAIGIQSLYFQNSNLPVGIQII